MTEQTRLQDRAREPGIHAAWPISLPWTEDSSTLALGEETGTSSIFRGEESGGPTPLTTMAVGEETGGVAQVRQGVLNPFGEF